MPNVVVMLLSRRGRLSLLVLFVLFWSIPSILLISFEIVVEKEQAEARLQAFARLTAARTSRLLESSSYFFFALEQVALRFRDRPSRLREELARLNPPRLGTGFAVLDADGRVLASGGETTVPIGLDFSNQPDVRAQMELPKNSLSIGLPWSDDMLTEQSVLVTRSVMNPETGKLLHVLAFFLSPSQVQTLLDETAVPLGGTKQIIGPGGRIYFSAGTDSPFSIDGSVIPESILLPKDKPHYWPVDAAFPRFVVAVVPVPGTGLHVVASGKVVDQWSRLLPFATSQLALCFVLGYLSAAAVSRLTFRMREAERRILLRDSTILSAIAQVPGVYIYEVPASGIAERLPRGPTASANPPWIIASMERFQTALRDGSLTSDLFVDRFSWSVIPRMVTWRRFGDLSNEVPHALVAQDLSELVNAQRSAFELSRLATLGEMSTALAHEIAQPLNIIGLTVSNLRRIVAAANLPDALMKIERVKQQIERSRKVIDHMRLYGRGQKDGDSCSVADAIAGTCLVLAEQLRLSEIALTTSVAPDLPDCAISQVQLEQVLLNLVGNSRDALLANVRETGPERSWISVTAAIPDKTGKDVEIVVEDNGGGVAMQLRSKLFVPFFTTKPIGKGTGLGLSICSGIMRDHGGSIRYESGRHGARFCVSVPILSGSAVKTHA
jgi:signal transduction histidine kinase